MMRPSLAISIALACLSCAPVFAHGFPLLAAPLHSEAGSGRGPNRKSGVAAAKRAARKARARKAAR